MNSDAKYIDGDYILAQPTEAQIKELKRIIDNTNCKISPLVESFDNWEPIETAPKDGTRILIYDNGDYGVAYYDGVDSNGEWISDGCIDDYYSYEPTHWMPLPEPPK